MMIRVILRVRILRVRKELIMRLVVVSVFDRAAEVFGRPFFVRALGEAVRSFQDEVNRVADDNPLCKHPEHYTLFHVAYWDEQQGVFMPADSRGPALLVDGTSANRKEA